MAKKNKPKPPEDIGAIQRFVVAWLFNSPLRRTVNQEWNDSFLMDAAEMILADRQARDKGTYAIGLQNALNIVNSKFNRDKNQGYNCAVSEIKTSILAEIERTGAQPGAALGIEDRFAEIDHVLTRLIQLTVYKSSWPVLPHCKTILSGWKKEQP